MNLVTVLPGAIIGPNFGRGTPSTDVIQAMMMGSMRMGTVDSIFPALDVRDVADAHILAAQNDADGRFIVGADTEPTFHELLKIMNRIDQSVPLPMMTVPRFAYSALPFFDWLSHKTMKTPRTMTKKLLDSIGTSKMVADNQRAKSVLGWRPNISLEQSLRDTMNELKQQR